MQNVTRKHIFIIDDSADNQNLLSLLFEAQGYRVNCASNGEEALFLLNDMVKLPDLILLDAQMPQMDGYQFRIEQKKDARIRNVPVIVMTGDDDTQMSQKMNNPAGILTKPLHIRSVIDCLAPFLSDNHHVELSLH